MRKYIHIHSMENTKITQEWLNKQTYETLADIVEMLYCTHTIDIPEWSEMTAEKIKTRCEEWGACKKATTSTTVVTGSVM